MLKVFQGLRISGYGNIKDADNGTLLHDAWKLNERIDWEKGKHEGTEELRLYEAIMREIKSR